VVGETNQITQAIAEESAKQSDVLKELEKEQDKTTGKLIHLEKVTKELQKKMEEFNAIQHPTMRQRLTNTLGTMATQLATLGVVAGGAAVYVQTKMGIEATTAVSNLLWGATTGLQVAGQTITTVSQAAETITATTQTVSSVVSSAMAMAETGLLIAAGTGAVVTSGFIASRLYKAMKSNKPVEEGPELSAEYRRRSGRIAEKKKS